MRLYWESSPIHKKVLLIVSGASLLSHLAFALTIGPMQTKRDRTVHSPAPRVTSGITFEQIIEAYLREDFASVERLSGPYLSDPRAGRAEEVRQMRSAAVIKLSNGPRPEASNRDTLNINSKVSNVSLLRSNSTFGTGSGSTKPLNQFALEQSALYCVQVGSFSRQMNAERLLNRLLRDRYDAFITKNGKSLIRVRVGHLATRAEADKLENRLKKDGYPTKIFP